MTTITPSISTGRPRVPTNARLDRRRRLLVLAIGSMSMLLVGLDTTIVNVALPAIRGSLDASVAGLQWTVDAYTLVLASLLMLSGSMADRFGRKRVFLVGLVVFTCGSALCALASSLEALIGARVLQAIGGSMLSPVALSIVRNVFDDPRELAQAIGVWAAMFGISIALGPVVGGALVDGAGWRYVFVVNVPLGLLALILATRYVPESRAEHPRALDPVGQSLVIAALASLTCAIIEGPGLGFGSAPIVALFAFSAASAVTLVRYELRRSEPLLEMRFFRSVPFSGASAIAILAFAALAGLLFQSTLYLQEVRHLSPLHAGLCILPLAAMTLVFAPLSGRLVGRGRSRTALVLAGWPMMIAPLLLTGLTPSTPLGLLIIAFALFGVGFGFVNPPITNTAVAGMPAAQAGVAAAVASTSRQVGATLGVAVIGAVAGSGAAGTFGAQPVAGMLIGWWVIAALGGGVLFLGALSTSAWAQGTAREVAARHATALHPLTRKGGRDDR